MPDFLKSLRIFVLRVAIAGVGLGVLAGASNAAPDWGIMEMRSDLKSLTDRLNESGLERGESVRVLTRGLDWPGPRKPERALARFFEPAEDAELGWSDIRYSLAALNQAYGAKDSFDILQANRRGENLSLTVNSGVATIAQLRARLTHRHLGLDFGTQDEVLRTPIIVQPGATLRLGPGDVLKLSRRDGAFILNFGRLEIFGSNVSATEDVSPFNEEFVPFIASVGTGTVQVSGAVFSGLGFGKTAKFSGFSMISHPTMRPNARSVIENSRFEGLVTLAIVGQMHVELRDNRLFDMRRNPLLISRSPDALVAGNLFAGPSPTNAIRVSNGSDGVRIVDNIILEGSRAGMLISSGSDRVSVRGNLIWKRNGGGVKLQDVECGRVVENIILDDRQKGVEVRSSMHTLVSGNRIVGNKGAGVMVAAQMPTNVTYVTDNLLRENGAGLYTASGAGLALRGNDMSNQLPRLLDGDITQQFRAIVTDLRGEVPIVLDGGGVSAMVRTSPSECDP
ncbi:right-handed parallel beta-helix repeat-containing protein [Boseongicola aestuarii]|uniref:Poly(Beta-D-mannuronate) C5 epimerase n=1 Tax=Boseongicola aestuarii TaxID=1470561 RepID=A0A238J1G5_9RHOB|nr:right-handed parallel beta-helix repeat-containing protein [Boseongicola aestuarii]SMX24015.1 Poly(beta-D-mannuronate) C5 epimerase precursor [Boseongicola aestuarii]